MLIILTEADLNLRRSDLRSVFRVLCLRAGYVQDQQEDAEALLRVPLCSLLCSDPVPQRPAGPGTVHHTLTSHSPGKCSEKTVTLFVLFQVGWPLEMTVEASFQLTVLHYVVRLVTAYLDFEEPKKQLDSYLERIIISFDDTKILDSWNGRGVGTDGRIVCCAFVSVC